MENQKRVLESVFHSVKYKEFWNTQNLIENRHKGKIKMQVNIKLIDY